MNKYLGKLAVFLTAATVLTTTGCASNITNRCGGPGTTPRTAIPTCATAKTNVATVPPDPVVTIQYECGKCHVVLLSKDPCKACSLQIKVVVVDPTPAPAAPQAQVAPPPPAPQPAAPIVINNNIMVQQPQLMAHPVRPMWSGEQHYDVSYFYYPPCPPGMTVLPRVWIKSVLEEQQDLRDHQNTYSYSHQGYP